MSKLTSSHKEKLIKLFPDGEAIGRAIVQEFIDIERQKIFPDTKIKSVVSHEDLEFLSETITTEEEGLKYDRYIKLREALFGLRICTENFEHLFSHGYYRTLYCIQPAMMGIGTFNLTPSLLANKEYDEYKETLTQLLQLADKGIMLSWNILKHCINVLQMIDLAIIAIGERYSFNLDVLRPDLEDKEDDIKNLQVEFRTFLDMLNTYLENTNDIKERVNIPENTIDVLNTVLEANPATWQLSDKLSSEIFSAFREAEINIPTINVFIRSITGR